MQAKNKKMSFWLENLLYQDAIRDPMEKVIGVIPNNMKKKGLFGQECINVVVTDKRIILAQLTSRMIQDEAKKVASEHKGNFITKFFSTATCGYQVYKRYFEMQPDVIVGENAGNISLPRESIEYIKFEKRREERNNLDTIVVYMKIKAASVEHRMHLANMSEKEAREMLLSVFPDKVK